jgi:hypothetical protein
MRVRLDRLPSGPQLCIDFWRIGIVVIFWTRKDAAP